VFRVSGEVFESGMYESSIFRPRAERGRLDLCGNWDSCGLGSGVTKGTVVYLLFEAYRLGV
jgi:hypothetical protein